MRRRPRVRRRSGDEALGAGLVAHWPALAGVRGMSQGSDATPASEGQKGCEQNRWIKSLPRIDLLGMRRPGQEQSDGELMTCRDAEKPTDDALTFDIRARQMLLDQSQYLSSPSQNLNLRPSSIWLPRAENYLRPWPLGVRSSVAMRSRKGPCRTPSGRLFGPIGRLFRPSGHGPFRVALVAAWPCMRQACTSNDRQVNG